MFTAYLREKLALDYATLILVFDPDKLLTNSSLGPHIREQGFEMISYTDPEEFRYLYESRLRDDPNLKVLIHVRDSSLYVPYDVRQRSYIVELSFKDLFPKLDPIALKNYGFLDLDLLYLAYQNYFGDYLNAGQTRDFLEQVLYQDENVREYLTALTERLRRNLCGSLSYAQWFDIAQQWARIRFMVDAGFSSEELESLATLLDASFQEWMLANYKYLSGSTSVKSPVLIHKSADFIRSKSKKAALVLIDGMSVENWLTFLAYARDFNYDMEIGNTFAFVPSVTSISRQSVFSGMLPLSHGKPFVLTQEEKQWREFWQSYRYKNSEIFFGRGYDVDIPYPVRIAGIVINTIDDLMHGQFQGQRGMIQDISLWAQRGELQGLIKRLLASGFDVYITSDHGNVEAKGQGKPGNEGVLTEMTSQRARIYQDFASTAKLEEEYRVVKYPGTYLPKDYQYYLAAGYTAFATKGRTLICHGGMGIEEVIVPFIQIKKGKNDE